MLHKHFKGRFHLVSPNLSYNLRGGLLNFLITNGSIFAKGRILYSGITNDTCAETMLQILRPYVPELPKGKGKTGTYYVYIRAVTPWGYDSGLIGEAKTSMVGVPRLEQNWYGDKQ